MAIQLLTDQKVKTAKPGDKPLRMSDGGGLYLLIQVNGAKWWRLDYTFGGKRKTLSLGVYPAVRPLTSQEIAQAAGGPYKSVIDALCTLLGYGRVHRLGRKCTPYGRKRRLLRFIALTPLP